MDIFLVGMHACNTGEVELAVFLIVWRLYVGV